MKIHGVILSFKSTLVCVLAFWHVAAFAEINMASGNYSHTVIDYQNIAEPELNIERTYNSVNGGWSTSFLSEQLIVLRNYTDFTENYGPYTNYNENGQPAAPYYQNRNYSWPGHALVVLGSGEKLPLVSEVSTDWVSTTDSKSIISCLSPVSFNNINVANNQPAAFGFIGTTATYQDCGSFYIKWSDGKEQTFGLKIGGVYKLTAIKLRNGWSATLAYDTAGKLLSVTPITNRTINFSYDSNGQLASITAPGNYTINYQYASGALVGFSAPGNSGEKYQYTVPNAPQLLSSVSDSLGNLIEKITYDVNHKVTQVEKAGGREKESVVYIGDSSAQLTNKEGILENYTFDYFKSYVLTSIADANGLHQYYYHDDKGRLIYFSDKKGNGTSVSPNDDGSVVETILPNGLDTVENVNTTIDKPIDSTTQAVVTSYTYDSKGNALTKTVAADGVTRNWSYTYDSLSKLTSVTDPVKGKTTYTYLNNMLTSIKNSLGHTWTINSTNAHGFPLKVTDPNGSVVLNVYDDANRLLSTQFNSSLTTYSYNPRGKIDTITNPDGTNIRYFYNDADQVNKIVKSDGSQLTFVLDNAGRPTQLSIAGASGIESAFQYSYSPLTGFLTGVTNGAGKTMQYDYDANGNVTSITDPLNRTTTQDYDSLDNWYLQSKAGDNVSVGRDLFGNITNFSSPSGQSTSYYYNGFGQVIQQDSPSTGSTYYTYKANGLINTITDNKGVVSTYTYDGLGRVKNVAYTGGVNIARTYDTAQIGKLTSVSGDGATLTYAYTNNGQVKSLTQTVGTVSKLLNYSWDAAGKLTSTTTPSGYKIDFNYAQGSQLPSGISVNNSPLITNIAWSPSQGIALSWLWGNGTARNVTLDAAGNISSVVSGTSLVRTLTRNDAGQILTIKRDPASTAVQAFTYDAKDQLLSEAAETGAPKFYTYDPDGNRLSQSQSGQATVGYGYGSEHLIYLSANTLSYDENGSLIDDTNRQISYNSRGRMASIVKAGKTTTYKYNGLGQRYSKTGMLFVYDLQGHLVGEYTNTGVLVQEYVWLGDTPIAVLRAGANGSIVYYVYSDELNTPRAITDTTNKLMWSWKSDAFGNGLANEDPTATGTKFVMNLRFPGQYFDKESGLHYNYFRDYDPSIGRYIESDPIGLNGGINTYAYVEGNPIRFIDPYGLLTDAAQKVVDDAMARHCGGDLFDVYSDVLYQRDNNPYDPALRDAEHYLFARDWAGSTYGIAAASLVPAAIGYSSAKFFAGPLAGPGKSWDTSNTSWSEMSSGLEGTAHGVRDAVRHNGGKAECSCSAN